MQVRAAVQPGAMNCKRCRRHANALAAGDRQELLSCRQCKPPMQSSAANALAAKRRQCPCAQVSKRSAQSSNAPDFAAPQLQYQTSHHDTNYRSIILPVTSSMGCAAAYHWRDIWPSLLANGVTWRQCNRCGTFYRSSDFRLTIRSMEYKTPGHLAA